MENRKYDTDAETCVAQDFAAKVREKAEQLRAEKEKAVAEAEKLGNQKTEQLHPTPLAGVAPQQIKKKTRAGIYATLAAGLITGTSLAAGGYLYVNKKGPFSEEQASSAAAPAASSVNASPSESSAPDEVNNDEDLAAILKDNNIRATEADFNFPASRPQLHARALMLSVEKNEENPEKVKVNWIPVRQRITRVDDPQLLVAVKVINRYVKDNPLKHIAPEGLSYRASAVDPADPSVIYFYYDCADKKNPDLLGQIGLLNPQNPKKLLWGVSFAIPACERQ